jgi:hypothetical protein
MGYQLITSVIIILIILLFVIFNSGSTDDTKGIWTVSEQFAEKAGIDTMIMFIGEPENNLYPCYILISNGGNIFENLNCNAKIKRCKNVFNTDNALTDYIIEFENTPAMFPQTLTLRLNKKEYSCVLLDNDTETIYGLLYKDNEATAEANRMLTNSADKDVDSESDDESGDESDDESDNKSGAK